MKNSIIAAVLLLQSLPAFADPITYKEDAIASGNLGGLSFVNSPISVMMSGDTKNLTSSFNFTGSTLTFNNTGSTTITVANLSPVSMSNPSKISGSVTFSSIVPITISDTKVNSIVLGNFAPVPKTYNFVTSVGPVSGSSFFSSGSAFPTAVGNFVLTGVTGSTAIFTAATPLPFPMPSGATLDSTGSISNVSGVVVPGGPNGALRVSGNYTQASTGTLLIQADPTGVSKLAVGGAVSLAGTLSVQPGTAAITPFSKVAILTAGNGVNGTFGQVVDGLPVPISVQYLANEVDLSLGGFTGVTRNQIAVANVLNAAFPTATGDFATVLGLTASLPSAQMQQSLSSFGGQIYANLAEVSLQDRRLFLGAMDERNRLLSGGSPSVAVLGSLGGSVPGWGTGGNGKQLAAIGNAISDPQLATAEDAGPTPAAPGVLWARGFGQFASIGNNGGGLGADFSTGGGAVGADLIHTPTSLLGLAVGGGQSSVSLNTNPENGTVSFVQFGVYGAQALDYGAAMDGALAYAHDFYDVTRGIVLPGTSRTATSSHGGNDVALDIGLSRPIAVDSWQITPRVGLSYFHIDQASFTERGADSLDLAVKPAALNALYSRVGVAIGQPMVLGDTSILPEFRAAWLHNFLDTQGQFGASFLGAGSASLGQVGAAVGREAGDLGVGVSVAIAQTDFPGQMSGFIQYDATLAAHETANAIAAGLRLKW